jgi:DNA topoisomerase III
MNGSRAVTLGAQNAGTAYPVGRVQTPTLGLVVRREWEIRNFVTVAYYELEAQVKSAGGATFKMFHAPAEKDRIRDLAEAQRRKSMADGVRAPLDVKTEPKSESPPLPYTLPALQKDANRLLGLSARATLKLAQELYEAKAITYPRTDCQYLAASQKGEVEPTLDRLAKLFPAAVAAARASGVTMRDSTFNDAKLSDHHGICPTVADVTVSVEAAKLFSLIAQRYLRTISADCLFDKTTVLLDANTVPFRATGKIITSPGFRSVKIGTEADEDKDEEA